MPIRYQIGPQNPKTPKPQITTKNLNFNNFKMYKEIEDVLKDAMRINTGSDDLSKEEISIENCSNITPDPLQGIEEGLELVNNILTNTLDKNNTENSVTLK